MFGVPFGRVRHALLRGPGPRRLGEQRVPAARGLAFEIAICAVAIARCRNRCGDESLQIAQGEQRMLTLHRRQTHSDGRGGHGRRGGEFSLAWGGRRDLCGWLGVGCNGHKRCRSSRDNGCDRSHGDDLSFSPDPTPQPADGSMVGGGRSAIPMMQPMPYHHAS